MIINAAIGYELGNNIGCFWSSEALTCLLQLVSKIHLFKDLDKSLLDDFKDFWWLKAKLSSQKYWWRTNFIVLVVTLESSNAIANYIFDLISAFLYRLKILNIMSWFVLICFKRNILKSDENHKIQKYVRTPHFLLRCF